MERKRHNQMKEELINNLDVALDRLRKIWDEIGIIGEQRKDRTHVVMVHLRNLLDEMVQEEESLKTKLMRNVETYGEELLKLCKELALPPHEVTPGEGLSILQLEKELRTQVDLLAKKKHERMKQLKKLKETDQHLCDVLCTTPYYIPTGSVPSNEQLKELGQHIQTLSEEKDRRYRQFKSAKSTIVKLLDDLDQNPNTSFERDIVCEEEDSFLLSTENMKALQILKDELEQRQKENFATARSLRERVVTLWERLQIPESEREELNLTNTGFKPKTIKSLKEEIRRCEELMVANIKQVIEATRNELVEWWDKCYFSQQQREAFKPFFSEDFTEELLEQHDTEVQRMKQLYDDNQNMFEKVARRQKLWVEFLEFERKAADPNRFFNRGCNLLKEEKARKKLMKELPRVEQEVADQIEEWEKQMGREFLVEGVRFLDYIKYQWENYKVQKENEKSLRHQAKAKQTEEEMIYGSRPVTPAKRRFANGTTPSKTPKQRKLHETPGAKTPVSASRLGKSVNHTSLFMSPMHSVPKSTSKSRTPHHGTRRALGERNGTNDTMFSQTTISGFGGSVQSLHSQPDLSLASVGGYNDFAVSIPLNSTVESAPGDPSMSRCTSSPSLARTDEYRVTATSQSLSERGSLLIGLNSTQKVNCRSSVVPKPRPAYF